MKKLIFGLILLIGCSAAKGDTQNDAGVPQDKLKSYINYKAGVVKTFYWPRCMISCLNQIGNLTESKEICNKKCNKDLGQIYKVMEKAVYDNKEDDFDDMIKHWYD